MWPVFEESGEASISQQTTAASFVLPRRILNSLFIKLFNVILFFLSGWFPHFSSVMTCHLNKWLSLKLPGIFVLDRVNIFWLQINSWSWKSVYSYHLESSFKLNCTLITLIICIVLGVGAITSCKALWQHAQFWGNKFCYNVLYQMFKSAVLINKLQTGTSYCDNFINHFNNLDIDNYCCFPVCLTMK